MDRETMLSTNRAGGEIQFADRGDCDAALVKHIRRESFYCGLRFASHNLRDQPRKRLSESMSRPRLQYFFYLPRRNLLDPRPGNIGENTKPKQSDLRFRAFALSS